MLRNLSISKLIVLISSVSCVFSFQTKVAVPNWDVPRFDPSADSVRNQILTTTVPVDRIEFSFKLPSFERVTSAAVYDASGRKVRTLWMNRSYEAGEHREVWDGNSDYGARLPRDRYTVKVGFNNMVHTWDGIIGNTEDSWSSYKSWSGIVPSFIRSLAFVNGKAYSANGYNEGGYAAAVFDEHTPNAEVRPLTKLVFSTLQHFMFAATDGKLVYFGFQTYGTDRYPGQGVIAFTPSGDYYRFPRGDAYPSFPKDTATFWNDATIPPTGIPDVRVVDMSPYPSAAVTGVAVERNGRVLATAHGFYQPGGSHIAAQSANEIRFFDKTTGEYIGKTSVPNPQVIAFDLENHLWVISGYGTNDKLHRLSDVGGSNLIDTPIKDLSNPVSVAVSPKTGAIFVADGGVHQQVRQYEMHGAKLISTIGDERGYLSGGACNATVTNTKFWLDPGPNVNELPVIGNSSPFLSWVSVDDNDEVWVGDYSTSRILHFTHKRGGWAYVNRIMYLPWALGSSVASADPARVFGGPTGFLEFRVDYSVPLRPGDPESVGGNHSWDLVRNWLPCYVAQDSSADLAVDIDAYSFPNGAVIAPVYDHRSGNEHTLLKLEADGELKVKHIPTLPKDIVFDSDGSYYLPSIDSAKSGFTVSYRKYPVSGYDENGFPSWYSIGKLIGGYTASHQHGEPVPRDQAFTYWPSSNGVIPVFDVEKNFDVPAGSVAFHLGGLKVGSRALEWLTMPEKTIPFSDGNGSFPSADVRGRAHMGASSWAVDDNLFAFENGNGSPWSCQFFQFKDDGLFVGQFGFQTSPSYPPTNISWRVTGYPQKGTEQALAPGECTDVNKVTAVRFKNDYYIYLGDESYHKGIHRWRVSNLASYGEVSGSGQLGTGSLLVLR